MTLAWRCRMRASRTAETRKKSCELTVRLPASTRIRLTLTLTLRARPPAYATPFGR